MHDNIEAEMTAEDSTTTHHMTLTVTLAAIKWFGAYSITSHVCCQSHSVSDYQLIITHCLTDDFSGEFGQRQEKSCL